LCAALFLTFMTVLQSASAFAVSFQQKTVPGGFGPNAIVVGDFNHDGLPDIVAADSCVDMLCASGGVTVLLGKGNGAFGPPKSYVSSSDGEYTLFIAAGDFNNDGNLDLAVANNGLNVFGDVSVMLGNGDGTFQSPVSNEVGGSTPVWVAVGDFNHDGSLDLAVTVTTTGTVAILLGNGDGTFQPQVSYDVQASPQGMRVADVNGDGNLDLVVANECGPDPGCRNGTVSVSLGNGDGTFQALHAYWLGMFPLDVEIVDLNGDGHPDLVTAAPCNQDPTCTHRGAVGVLMNNGDGTFRKAKFYAATGYDTVRVASGDFNGDGIPDVVALNYQTAQVTLFLGNGDGTLPSGIDYKVGQNPISPGVADFNRDGRLDLAVDCQIPDDVSLFLNTSN
jgi:hypothetical protein